jgi:hypothetical protein
MSQVDTLVEPGNLDYEVQAAARDAASQSRGAIIAAKRDFGLIAGKPGFGDDDITLDDHYAWANYEAVQRLERFLSPKS